MGATAGTTPVVDESARTLRERHLWHLLLTAAIALAIFAATGIANYRLNPLIYDRAELRAVAEELENGKNYALYDTSINWRALRREQIKAMTTTPDVIVFGGSRWWQAHSDLVPGQTFFNAWVSNDQAEDALALAYLLDKHGRLPKTLILSLRFISFQPLDQRDQAEWQEWAPEYRLMADKLGVTPHLYTDTLPVKALSGMFYLPGVYSRAQQLSAAAEVSGPTTDKQKKSLEILAEDGSIYWSQKSIGKQTKNNVDKAWRAELKKIGQKAPQIDQSLVESMAKAIDFLQGKGVRVVLAQTPYHPDFYAEIQKRPFGKTLNNLESIADDMQRRFGVISVGTYDPAVLGCVAEDFIDHIHATPRCVGKVLALIPGLNQEPLP